MAKTYTGEIRNGVIVFEGILPKLPDGTRVRVELIETSPGTRMMADRLATVIGRAQGLPTDLAEQHDHYLHDQPRR